MATLEHLTASDVRRMALAALQQSAGSGAGELDETILLRDGNYLGRRFDLPGGCALWLIDEERLTIYDLRGRELQVISTAQHPEQLRQEPLRWAA